MPQQVAINLILTNLKDAHGNLLQTMEGVTDEVASFSPPGKANSIAGTYAHLVFSEDFFTQNFLKHTKPLFETDWKDKTGISELQPTEWVDAYPKWLKTVSIDTKQVCEYVKAVFAATEAYVSTLSEDDLVHEVDMSMFGMGKRPVGEFISGMIIGHANNIMGEVSVLKGIQNLKGYPF